MKGYGEPVYIAFKDKAAYLVKPGFFGSPSQFLDHPKQLFGLLYEEETQLLRPVLFKEYINTNTVYRLTKGEA